MRAGVLQEVLESRAARSAKTLRDLRLPTPLALSTGWLAGLIRLVLAGPAGRPDASCLGGCCPRVDPGI
jgi:hypothetical protein